MSVSRAGLLCCRSCLDNGEGGRGAIWSSLCRRARYGLECGLCRAFPGCPTVLVSDETVSVALRHRVAAGKAVELVKCPLLMSITAILKVVRGELELEFHAERI